MVRVCAQPGVSTYHGFLAGSRPLTGAASAVIRLDNPLCLAPAVLEMPGPRCACYRTVLDRLVFWLMTVGLHQWLLVSFLGAESWLLLRFIPLCRDHGTFCISLLLLMDLTGGVAAPKYYYSLH